MKIKNILEEDFISTYLESRKLLKQYKKAKNFILEGNFDLVDFKERKPKGSEIFYFRINKQFRALCYFLNSEELIVFKIDNHQT